MVAAGYSSLSVTGKPKIFSPTPGLRSGRSAGHDISAMSHLTAGENLLSSVLFFFSFSFAYVGRENLLYCDVGMFV